MIRTLKSFKQLLKWQREHINGWVKGQHIRLTNPYAKIGSPIVWAYDDAEMIEIGTYASIGAFSEIVVCTKPSKSKILGRLIIKENVVIGSQANIRAAGGEIFIGKNSIIAQQVSLIASNHRISKEGNYLSLPWDESKTGIFIDENTWIGAGVVILPGCSIGRNSIVGAGSVVTKSIPSDEIWVGAPAQKMKGII